MMIRLPRLQDWTMPYLPEKTGTVYHRLRAFFIEAPAFLGERKNGLSFAAGLDGMPEVTSFRCRACRVRRTPEAFPVRKPRFSGPNSQRLRESDLASTLLPSGA